MQGCTMKNAKYLAKLFIRDIGGATAIEYGLIAGVMGLMLIPVMFTMSTTVKEAFFDIMIGLFEL